jgi:uncharacterized protein YkwD
MAKRRGVSMAARRCASVVLAATVLAVVAAIGVFALEAEEAGARGAATVRTCGGGRIDLEANEQRTLQLHNRAREQRKLKPLCVHPALQKAARAHSAAMIKKDRLFHGSVGTRLKRHGYKWKTYGENIAGGSGRLGTPKGVFKRWMKSRTHRPNILKKGFREVGIGTASGTFKGIKGYTMYTADFGTRR